MARSSQAVVVEGYTDVMACHLAGVTTAVATCGTAFGDEHAKVLRRFLHDHEEFRGEVIFTFDGDAAGQKAALRAFEGDQNFVSQTYVAVEPDGLDPCDLRIQKGDAAVRELVARRVPLYRFVLANVVGKYDLDRADGRVDAVREAARLVSSIRDKSKVDAFSRELAGMVGVDIEQARDRGPPRRQPARRSPRAAPAQPAAGAEQPVAPPRQQLPDLRDPRFSLERETLKLVVQYPSVGRPVGRRRRRQRLPPPDLPRGVGARRRAGRSDRPAPATTAGPTALRDAAPDPAVSSAISALGVEPLLTAKEPDHTYVVAHVYRLLELTAMRRIADLKSRLQRTNPVEHPTDYNRMFGELVALEAAPPQPPRAGGRRLVRRRTKPPVAVGPGEKVLAWTTAGVGRGRRRHPRRAVRRRPTRSRGSRSRPPTGTATPPCSGSARSARGASSGSSTTSRSTSPAGCWS